MFSFIASRVYTELLLLVRTICVNFLLFFLFIIPVVVSHYLWRHYELEHKHLQKDVTKIYQHLKSIRSGVEPLSYIRYVTQFEQHLIRRKMSKK